MEHLDIDTVLGWRGRTVRDPDGHKVGTLGDVFLDSETDMPAWGGVRTGLFGRHENYVPLDRIEEDGDDLRVPFAKDVVTDAPRIEPDIALDREQERRLYDHYGQAYVPLADDPDAATRPEGTAERLRLRRADEEPRHTGGRHGGSDD